MVKEYVPFQELTEEDMHVEEQSSLMDDTGTQLSKDQYQRLMKRPSMSELEDVITRQSRRDSRLLQQEHLYVDKLAKIHLSEHDKKQQDFVRGRAQYHAQTRRSSDSSINHHQSESFRRLSVLDPRSNRGSLLNTPSNVPYKPSQKRFGAEERRASICDELRPSNISNRKVEIRRKLSLEFNMPQKATHRRPWSPHGSSAGSDMFNTHPRFHRRMSEPIPKLSDKLSAEIQEKLDYITGKKTRHSVADIASVPSEEDNGSSEQTQEQPSHQELDIHSTITQPTDDDYFDEMNDTQSSKSIGMSTVSVSTINDSDRQRQSKVRRHSEVVNPALTHSKRKSRRHSETMLRESLLPPLMEKR